MLNHIVEIDVLKMVGSTREVKTLYFTARRVSPQELDVPHVASIASGGLPTITKAMTNVIYGSSSVGYGQLVVENGNGRYDELIQGGWILENRPIRVLIGDTTQYKSTYTMLLTSRTGQVSATADRITFQLNDGSLDLDSLLYPDQEEVSTTVQVVIDTVVEIVGCAKDSSVTEWLAANGSTTVFLNFTSTTLVSALDATLTPFMASYGFTEQGALYITTLTTPAPESTPVLTLTARDVLPGYSRTGLNRLYWKVTGQFWSMIDTAMTATPVHARDARALTGEATSIADGTKTGLPVPAHGWAVGDTVRIDGDSGFQKMYYVQAESTTDVLVIDKVYAAHTFANAYIRNTTAFPLSTATHNIGGLFLVEADAQEAVNTWLDFFKIPRYKYRVTTKKSRLKGVSVKFGDHVRLVLPRPYGTVNGMVYSYSQSIANNDIYLEVLA